MSDSSVTLLALAVCAMIVIAISGDAQAPVADPRPQYVTAEIIVKFHVDTESSTRYNIRSEFADHTLRTFKSGAEHWNLRSTYSVEDAVDRLSRDPAIKYAHPNWYVVPAATIPNDTRFSEQWSLYNTGQSVGGSSGTVDKDIDSELAWDISTGSASVVIAIIEDSGADLGHSDLAPNIWSNAGEVGGFQGVDDDGNGHVDDLKGWDWAEGDGEPVPWSTSLAGCTQIGPLSALRHGTAVAGIIGAVGNNEKGVSGVNWAVRMMILKHTGNIATATAAVEYAIENRANIINASWRVTCTAPCEGVLEEAIEDAMEKEIPFIVAADNNSMDIDVNPIYPASYDISNVIPVAATDANDALAPFSNYGGSTVDLRDLSLILWKKEMA